MALGSHIHCCASDHSMVLTPTDARATLALILQSRRTSLFRMQGGRNDIDENIGRFPPKC